MAASQSSNALAGKRSNTPAGKRAACSLPLDGEGGVGVELLEPASSSC